MILTLFVLAAAVRTYRIDAPGMLMDREFNSAIVARNFYFARADDIEPWRKELARKTRENQPELEPPVTEWLVSLAYSLTGEESLRYARILNALFWLTGGWFLFRISRSLVSTDAAVFALAYYLFVPMSVLLSRSFQPDSLMMMLFLASLCLVVRYHQEPSRRALVVAIALAAATVLCRPIVLAALVGAFVVPNMQRRGVWRGALNITSLAYAAGAMFPTLLHYGYQTLVTGRFGNQLAITFQPYRYLTVDYWKGWHDLAVWTIGTPMLLAAAVGFAFLRPGLPRAIVAGLGLGYVAFGLFFTMHIQTHDYYQAQLIPLVAIAASPVVAGLARGVQLSLPLWPRLALFTFVAAVVAIPWWRDLNEALTRAKPEPPETAREIGSLVRHSATVVFIAKYYGVPLQYSGEFTGTFWPRPITYYLHRNRLDRPLSIEERWSALGFEPEYFVITSFGEFERHHQDLAAYLDSNCTGVARTPAYLVYGNCRPPTPGASQ